MYTPIILFIKAWICGIALSAPIGPIGLLCIKKTIEFGFLGGLCIGIGAACADLFYALSAGTGVSMIQDAFTAHLSTIKIIGGSFLITLGIKELMSQQEESLDTIIDHSTYIGLIIKSLLLTITNPMTFFIFLGIFASLSGHMHSSIDIAAIALGIYCGSLSWWIFLCTIIASTRSYLSLTVITRATIFSASMLLLLGILAIANGLEFFSLNLLIHLP